LTLEYALVGRYHWSLYEIDRADFDSLLEFVFFRPKSSAARAPLVTCDQVSWL